MVGSLIWIGVEVGRVAAVWRYPVKFMAPEPVLSAQVSWHGVAGDRRWAFVRERGNESGFPWLTIRDRPDMVRYRARLADPEGRTRHPSWCQRRSRASTKRTTELWPSSCAVVYRR